MQTLTSDLADAVHARRPRRLLGVVTACMIAAGLLALTRGSALAPFVYAAF